MFVDIKKVFIL